MTGASLAPMKVPAHRPVLLGAAFVSGGGVLLMLLLSVILPGIDADHQSLLEARQPSSPAHWLGTDPLGRDVLARVVAGTGLTVIGPAVVAVLASAVAIPLALLTASRRGLLAGAVLRVSDTIMATPALLLIIVIVGLLGGSYWLAVLVLAGLTAPWTLRILRSVAIGQQSMPYIEAARVMGTSRTRIMFAHVLPNLAPTMVATFLLDFVGALVALSSLSFLGLGAPPGSTDWGTMLSENLELITVNPFASLAPAVLLIMTAFAVTAIGDWLHVRLQRGEAD